MKIILSVIGKLKANQLESKFIEDYQKRVMALGKSVGIMDFSICEYEAKKGLSGEILKEAEAELLLKNIVPQDKLIALDERGDNLNSQDFSSLMQSFLLNNVSKCHFIIGGAAGLSNSVRERADKVISFGKLTWPHKMVRMMITEQIYRSITILTNHPYHKE